jgi:hypothetical protein
MALTEPSMALSPMGSSSYLTSGASFKLCVRSIKFEAEDGELQEKEGSSEITFRVGLLDLTQNDVQQIVWGKLDEIPTGYKLKKIKIKIHKDEALCGTNYSVKYDTYEFDKDIEFTFKFTTAMDLEDGSKVKLKLAQLVSTIATNAPSGAEATKTAVEALEHSAEKTD